MTRLRKFSPVPAACAAALLVLSVPALAETSASQRAAAEALFQQATQLMDEKRYPEACEKFAGSQELDPALGTMLYLADCYEHAGRTASAWALFREAADRAQRGDQPDRERIALERARSLEGRLSKLELKVELQRQVPGLELLVNGTAVPRASWNAPLPVDPGSTRVEARAPGKRSWRVAVTLAEGPASQSVEMPKLVDAPQPLRAPSGSGSVAPPVSSAQRTVGYVMTAAGVVALAASGFFGYRAYSYNKKSKAQCRADEPNSCTPEGVSLRESAATAGALSTIGTVSGGLLVASGITLVVTSPASAPPDERRTAQQPRPAFGVALRGVW